MFCTPHSCIFFGKYQLLVSVNPKKQKVCQPGFEPGSCMWQPCAYTKRPTYFNQFDTTRCTGKSVGNINNTQLKISGCHIFQNMLQCCGTSGIDNFEVLISSAHHNQQMKHTARIGSWRYITCHKNEHFVRQRILRGKMCMSWFSNLWRLCIFNTCWLGVI